MPLHLIPEWQTPYIFHPLRSVVYKLSFGISVDDEIQDYTCLSDFNMDALMTAIESNEDLAAAIVLVEDVEVTSVKRMQYAQTIFFENEVSDSLAEEIVAALGPAYGQLDSIGKYLHVFCTASTDWLCSVVAFDWHFSKLRLILTQSTVDWINFCGSISIPNFEIGQFHDTRITAIIYPMLII